MRAPAMVPCPTVPWHSKQPFFMKMRLPLSALPVASCAKAADASTIAARRIVFMASSLAGLRNYVDQRGLATLHHCDGVLDRGTQILRIGDRTASVHPIRFRHGRVIDVRIVNPRAHVESLDAAIG